MDFFGGDNLQIMGQLLLAALLGATVGMERELARKSAGMRTYALVSMGSCLFSVISIFAGDMASVILNDPRVYADAARIAAQVVTGIGFIGAGLTIFHQAKVQGLTTAAGVWVSAAIGMAVGFRMYSIAVFAAIVTIFIFVILWQIESRFVKKFSNNPSEDLI